METDHVFDLLGDLGSLERLQMRTMRLEAIGVSQALDRARWLRAGGHQHFGDGAARQRDPAGLARLVAQETSAPFPPYRCSLRQKAKRLTPT